jgi:hypothetical protein
MEVFAAGINAGDALFGFFDPGSRYAAAKKQDMIRGGCIGDKQRQPDSYGT